MLMQVPISATLAQLEKSADRLPGLQVAERDAAQRLEEIRREMREAQHDNDLLARLHDAVRPHLAVGEAASDPNDGRVYIKVERTTASEPTSPVASDSPVAQALAVRPETVTSTSPNSYAVRLLELRPGAYVQIDPDAGRTPDDAAPMGKASDEDEPEDEEEPADDAPMGKATEEDKEDLGEEEGEDEEEPYISAADRVVAWWHYNADASRAYTVAEVAEACGCGRETARVATINAAKEGHARRDDTPLSPSAYPGRHPVLWRTTRTGPYVHGERALAVREPLARSIPAALNAAPNTTGDAAFWQRRTPALQAIPLSGVERAFEDCLREGTITATGAGSARTYHALTYTPPVPTPPPAPRPPVAPDAPVGDRIVDVLRRAPNGETAARLAEVLKLRRPVIDSHLERLVESRAVLVMHGALPRYRVAP